MTTPFRFRGGLVPKRVLLLARLPISVETSAEHMDVPPSSRKRTSSALDTAPDFAKELASARDAFTHLDSGDIAALEAWAKQEKYSRSLDPPRAYSLL